MDPATAAALAACLRPYTDHPAPEQVLLDLARAGHTLHPEALAQYSPGYLAYLLRALGPHAPAMAAALVAPPEQRAEEWVPVQKSLVFKRPSRTAPSPNDDAQTGVLADRRDASSGVMVALMLPPDAAAQLALPGGEPAEELHCTIAYLGKTTEFPPEAPQRLLTQLRRAAAHFDPIQGRTSGYGVFTPEEGAGEPAVFYASLDAPALPRLRWEVEQAITRAGFRWAQNHGFSPHITLRYWRGADEPHPAAPPVLDITFPALTLAFGGEHYAVPFRQRLAKAADYFNPHPVAKTLKAARTFFVSPTHSYGTTAADAYHPDLHDQHGSVCAGDACAHGRRMRSGQITLVTGGTDAAPGVFSRAAQHLLGAGMPPETIVMHPDYSAMGQGRTTTLGALAARPQTAAPPSLLERMLARQAAAERAAGYQYRREGD